MSFTRIIFVTLCLTLASAASAQETTVDLTKVDPRLAAEILKAQADLARAEPKVPTVSQAKEWAEVGKNLAEAVGATAGALSISVNDFIKTPVGFWAFLFLFWYFLGAKLWSIVGGTLVWIILGSIIWRSFRIFHVPQRKLISETEDKVKKYAYVKYDFESRDARSFSVVVHVAAFFVLSMSCAVLIF